MGLKQATGYAGGHDYGQSNTATWLNTQGFTNAQASISGIYWSSTTNTRFARSAWFVNMYDGFVYGYYKTDTFYVWPVRAGESVGAPADQPKTGQTICYDSAGTVITCTNTGQDGALQKGVVWPSPRFTANADTAVTDNLTGLAWAPNGNLMPERDSGWDADSTANDGMVAWQRALDYVAKLNAENYLGHNDWRLPDVNELESLVNSAQSNCAISLNMQGFTNAQASSYWSSTSYTANANSAWGASMDVGFVDHVSKASGGYVWPVRAGQ